MITLDRNKEINIKTNKNVSFKKGNGLTGIANLADLFIKSQENLSSTRFIQDTVTNWVPKAVFSRSIADFAEMSFLEFIESGIFYFASPILGEKLFRNKIFKNFIPNQIREKVGVMFGNPETTTGGRALKFYSSIRLDIRRSEQIKDGTNIIGNKTVVKVVKNKVAPPFKQAEVDIIYGEGISHLSEVVDLGVSYDIIKKAGAWFSYNDTKIGQGKEAAKRYLSENGEVLQEIEEKLKEAMNINN